MASEFSNQYPTILSEFYLNAAPKFADALAIIRHKSYRFAIGILITSLARPSNKPTICREINAIIPTYWAPVITNLALEFNTTDKPTMSKSTQHYSKEYHAY